MDWKIKLISFSSWFTALDLDYLERRELGRTAGVTDGGVLGYAEQNSKSGLTNQIGTPVEPSPDSLDLVKVILLGAPAVGKTSIVQVCSIYFNFQKSQHLF